MLAVVIDKVDGHGAASKRVAKFARGIHDRFGVGSADCGSGAVVVVSVDDRQVHFCISLYIVYRHMRVKSPLAPEMQFDELLTSYVSVYLVPWSASLLLSTEGVDNAHHLGDCA